MAGLCCTVQCSCYTEHGRYGLSCLHAETVKYSATFHAYTTKDTRPSPTLLQAARPSPTLLQAARPSPTLLQAARPSPTLLQAARPLKRGNYAQSALRPLTSLKVAVTMESVCVYFCIVSCPHPTHTPPTPHPHPTQLTRGEGVWCYNPISLGKF